MKLGNTKYILIAAFICLFSLNNVIAQKNYRNLTEKKDTISMKPKVSVSLSTSFNSYGYGYNAMSTSIMPKVTFPVSKRLSLTAGVGYSTIFMNGTNNSMFNSGSSNYGHLFVSGDYLLTKKISIRGTAYKTFNLGGQPQMGAETSYPYLDLSSQGIIMDVEYKVTDNFRINVGFEYREQKYPTYGPGMNPMYPGAGNSNSFFDFGHSQGLTPF